MIGALDYDSLVFNAQSSLLVEVLARHHCDGGYVDGSPAAVAASSAAVAELEMRVSAVKYRRIVWVSARTAAFGYRPSASSSPFRARLLIPYVARYLARIVLPTMDWAGEDDWQELLAWLRELRELGGFPTLALPYLLVHRTNEQAWVDETISVDLHGEINGAVNAAAAACRHWILLSAVNAVPSPPTSLLTALVERVIFRRKPGIRACLGHLTNLMIEKPTAVSRSLADMLTSSLIAWDAATAQQSDCEFAEQERPDLRFRIGSLASGLNAWYAKDAPSEAVPAAIVLWRDSCASSPLPEVRRAFNDAAHLAQ